MTQDKNGLKPEYISYIIEELEKKNLNKETIDSIIEFCQVQAVAFSEVENIDSLVKEMVDKTNENIEYKKVVECGNGEKEKVDGGVAIRGKQIVINPKEKGKTRGKIIIFHELQHRKDNVRVELTNEEVMQKRDEILSRQKKHRNRKKLKKEIDEYISCSEGKFFMSGVSECLQDYLKYGTDLNYFMEGVTKYKQTKYEEIMGYKPDHNYDYELKLVKSVISLVGEKDFLLAYNNHNFDTIRNSVLEKTRWNG